MSKILTLTLVFGLSVAWTGSAWADKKEEVPIRESEIKKGRDFAPTEQRLTERDPNAYRRPGGILTRARHTPVRLDRSTLRKRRLGMYAGKTYTESLTGRVCATRPNLRPMPPSQMQTSGPNWGPTLAVALPLLLFTTLFFWLQRQIRRYQTARAETLRHRREQFKRRQRR